MVVCRLSLEGGVALHVCLSVHEIVLPKKKRCLFLSRPLVVQEVLVALFNYRLCYSLLMADIAAAGADTRLCYFLRVGV